MPGPVCRSKTGDFRPPLFLSIAPRPRCDFASYPLIDRRQTVGGSDIPEARARPRTRVEKNRGKYPFRMASAPYAGAGLQVEDG